MFSDGRTEATAASFGSGRGNVGNAAGGAAGDATGAGAWTCGACFRAAEWQELATAAATKVKMRPGFKSAPKRKATKTELLRSCSSGERILGQISSWSDWSQPYNPPNFNRANCLSRRFHHWCPARECDLDCAKLVRSQCRQRGFCRMSKRIAGPH